MKTLQNNIILTCIAFFLITSSYNAFGGGGCINVAPDYCHPDVPAFIVDFTGNPDSLWCSPDTFRNCQCCGGIGGAGSSCYQFYVTLDPLTGGVTFECENPPCPPGMVVMVECKLPAFTWNSGDPVCLSDKGVGPYQISACKPGSDNPKFCIQSIQKQNIPPDPIVFFLSTILLTCNTSEADSLQIPYVALDTFTNFILTFVDPYACTNDTVAVDSSSLWPNGSVYVCAANVAGPIWYPGDTIWHTYDSLGIYTLGLTMDDIPFCKSTIWGTVANDRSSTARFTAIPDSGCSTLTVTMFDSSLHTIMWDWYFGDGDSLVGLTDSDTTDQYLDPPPVHTFTNLSATNDTSYIIMLVANALFECPDTTYDTIVVNPIPSAGFTYSSSSPCSPVNICFNNSSLGKAPITYFWDFGDGDTSTLQNPCHTFVNDTIFAIDYNVTLTITSADGCSDTLIQPITIYQDTIFSVFPDTTGCSPFTVDFISCGGFSYQWDFGDGSTIDTTQNPTHTFQNPSLFSDTVYTVMLIIEDSTGFTDTISKNILVHPTPLINTFIPTSFLACTPNYDTICVSATGASSYYWDFGDSTFDTTNIDACIVHLYATDSVYAAYYPSIKVENNDGCSDIASTIIGVHPPVTAKFLIQPDTFDCSPFTVNFNDQTFPGGGNIYQWDFGDTTPIDTSQNPTHTYINSGTNNIINTIELIAISQYGCIDTAYQQITIFPKPIAYFTVSPDSQILPNSSVTVTNTGIYGSGSTFLWEFGDGFSTTLENPPSYTYNPNIAGTYCITFSIYSGSCSDIDTQCVKILPKFPVPDFTVDTNAGCILLTVNFTNLSQGTIDQYLWDFGDGSISQFVNPTHTYFDTGTFIVTLTVYEFTVYDTCISVQKAILAILCTGIEGYINNKNALLEVYPNPFNNTITIQYHIITKNKENPILYIYDALGRIIMSHKISPKQNNIVINTENMQNGIYWCVLKVDDEKVGIRKMVLIK